VLDVGHRISVLKFGGSSFANPAAYGTVARYLAHRVTLGEKLCVIVSAMSGTTGRLSELLCAISPEALPEDFDAVLGAGEILASALVRAAVAARGVSAVSLNAFQLGWHASGDFTCGQLTGFTDSRISAALERASVVVVAGGQATTTDGRLVMLGRNSSDLTAVAAAVALRCESVTLFSDVEGVFTSDPYRLVNARLIPKLSYQRASAYSRFGAKVLYLRCIELAQRHRIRIQCASLTADGSAHYGTQISDDGHGVQVCMPENLPICRIANVPTDCATAIDIDESPNLIPVVNLRGYFAACLTDSYHRMIDGGALIGCDDLCPVVAFAGDGSMHVYAVPVEQRVMRAQEIHDNLLIGCPFGEPIRKPSKQRGTHTNVFGDLSQAASL
jgi:aspartate kinase